MSTPGFSSPYNFFDAFTSNESSISDEVRFDYLSGRDETGSHDFYRRRASRLSREEVQEDELELRYKSAILRRQQGAITEALNNIRSSNEMRARLFGAYTSIFDEPSRDRAFSEQLRKDMIDHLLDRETDDPLLPEYNYFKTAIDFVEMNSIVDAERFRRNTFSTYSIINRIGNLNSVRRVLDNTSFVARPGIAPAALLIQTAKVELSFDIYQLQNPAIQDLLTLKIIDKVKEYRDSNDESGREKFRLNVRLALPDSGDSTSAAILGPNILFYRRLRILGQLFKGDIDIKFLEGHSGNHPKIIASEDYLTLSSQNLTAPIGKSIYQGGANYEAMRILHFSGGTKDNLSEEMKRDLLRIIREGRDEGILKEIGNKLGTTTLSAEQKLFLQAKIVLDRNMRTGAVDLRTGMDNIGGPQDTKEHLNILLDYVGLDSNRRMDFILDQPGFLAPFRQREISDIKEKVTRLLVGNRSTVIMDVRNYRQQVVDPVFSKLRENPALLVQFGYNLNDLVSALSTGSEYEDRVTSLLSNLQQKGYRDANRDLAVSLLAITSGNVIQSIVPRQHAKAYHAYEVSDGGIRTLGTKQGSSNPSMRGLGISERSNYELDLLLMLDEVRGLSAERSPLSLSNDEVEKQLLLEANAFRLMQSDLGFNSSIRYNDVNNAAQWERNVDHLKLEELYQSLKSLNSQTRSQLGGREIFKVSYNYRGGNPISVLVSVDPNAFGAQDFVSETKIKFEFTVAKTGASAKFKGKDPLSNLSSESANPLVLEVRKSKIVGFTEVINRSNTALHTGFIRGDQPLVIPSNYRDTLSPIESAVSLVSSLTYQAANKIFIEAPRTHLAYVSDSPRAMFDLVSRYILKLSNKSHLHPSDILDPQKITSSDLRLVANRFYSRFTTDISGVGMDYDLRGVRDVAGINRSDPNRVGTISFIAELIEVLAQVEDRNTRGLLLGLPVSGRTIDRNITSEIESLLMSPDGMYADVLYDMVSGAADSMYRRELRQALKDNISKIFSAYIMPAQNRVYSTTQGARRRVITGYTNHSNIEKVNEGGTGLRGLLPFSALMNPLPYNTSTYFGRGSRSFVREVAGGGGPSPDIRAEDDLYSGYKGYVGGSRVNKIGTETGIEIIQDANVGMILNRQSPQQYLGTVTHLINKYGLNNINLKALEDRLADSDSDLLIFNFDRVKKVAQIPQRIKNVIGSKILLDLTEEYQALLEFDLASEGANKIKYYSKIVNNVQLSGKGIGETEVSNVTELQDAYLRDIVDNLKSLGIEGDALYKRLFQEGYGVGALFSNKLKPFLSRDLAFEYEMLRRELIDEYFKGEDLFADRNEAVRNAANEMLRAKLLIIDTESSGMKGFLGSSRRTGDPTMLFQLSGAYSDPFFANPDFGSVDRDGRPSLRGLRQGYIDRAVKKIKASHLATSLENGIVSWHLGENVKLTAGDIIAFNDAQDQSWIYRIENGKRVKVGSVDSRSQVKLMTNIIESRGEVPIMAFNTATSANVGLIGEHGRESIRSIRILNGNPETGEISVEINYDRTLLPGAGRREEGSGLFKGVPIYIEGAMFPDLVENWNLQRAKDYERLASAQVRGLISMSNLKSYFFEHGSVLLTQNKGKNLERLINNIGSPQLAASILMSMGDPHERIQLSQKEEIGKLLVQGIESGQFGSALKSKFTLYQLQRGGSRGKEFYEDVYKEFVASTDKTAKLQMPALGLIDGSDLISALRGDSTILKDKVREILRDDSNKILNMDSGYLIVDTLRGREMASLAAGIDLMNDFFNSSTINLPIIGDLGRMMRRDTDTASVESRRQAQIMMKQLGIAANLTTEEIMNIENGEITDLGLLVHKIASNSHLLRLYISTSASQSKVPLSSKMTANIELQHIVSESFTINTEVFKRGGVVDQLRKIMATVLGSMVGSGGDFMLTATEKMDLVDLTSPRGRDPFFKSQMLGVYVNEIESTPASNSLMKNRYEAFHTLLMLNHKEGNYAQQMKSFIRGNKGIVEESAFTNLIPFIDKIIDGTDVDNSVMEIEARILQELSEMKSGIRESFERWAYFSDKAMNIEAAEAMMRGMMDSKRFAFSVPKFERIGGFVRFYKDKKEYGLALSGQDIALVGPQYGEFMSEIMSDTKEIWMAMAEGSIVNEIFNKVSKGFLESDSSTYDTILSEEEFRYLDSFYQVVRALPQNIVKASSGKRAQKLLGAKMPIEGATFTGAASWYMPHGRVVLPEESRRRYGAHPSLTRIAAFNKIRSRTHNLSDSIKGIQNELDSLSRENNLIPRDILNFEKQLAALRNERSILVYQNAMIATKLSPGASDRLTKLIGDSERITGLLKSQRDVSSISSIIDNIDEQIEEVTSLRIGKKDKADYYIRLLALQELTVLKGVALQMRGVHNEEESQVLEKAKRYLKLGSVVSGLTVSTEVKFAADALFKEQADEVLGEIRRREMPLISPDELRTPFKRNSNNSARLGLEEAITNQATGRKAVKNLIGWVERARKDYIKRANEFDLSESLVKAFRTTLNRLEGINQNIQDKSFSVESLKLDLQVGMSELFTEMSLSSVLAWRSPPPGSHSLLRSLFRSMDLGELDQHVRNMLGTNQSNVPLVAFTPKGDRPNRNRTLGMFNPITFIVSQLGDWDGDSVSAIFDYSVIARAEIFNRQQKIKELRSQIGNLRVKLKTVGNDAPRREQIEEEIAVLRNQINQLSKAKRIREQTLKENESRYGASEIRKAAVKWVGNYIGIDNRIFLGTKYGGWSSENRGEGVDFESLMVFVEQGRGLVGGMENVFFNEDVREGQGIDIKTTFSDLVQLVTRTEDLQSSDSFSARLSLFEPDLQLANRLASNDALRETIRTGILSIHSKNLENDENYSIKKSIIEYAAGLSAGQKGMSNLSNLFGRAYGTAIGADEFELMLNVIGQAGSSVLGKTYNATIGLLYNQSPLLALSNLILNDEQVIEYVRRMQGDDQLNRMQMEAREARNTSERVGGLLQTVNQIMRDSFKAKGNSQQFLDNLASKIQQIHKAKDDKERVKIIESISSEFGPGSGLRALMNIESLVKNLYLFSNETSSEEILEAQRSVLEEMGVSDKKEKDISRILGFEAEEVRGETQFSGYGRRPLVAAYKTKSDLISISAAFIVERNFNDRGSSYRELMSKFRKGFLDAPENLIGDEGIKLRRSTLELAGLFRDGLSEADQYELSRIGDSPTVRSNFTLSRAIRHMQEGLLSSRADLTEDDRLRFEYGEFLKSLAYHKGDSFSELSKDSLFTQYSSMSPEEKALVAHTFLETRDKIHAFSGDMGQDLLRFAEYDYDRRDAYSNRFVESPTDPGWDLPKVSREQARWQAIVSGKVGPDMIAQFLVGSINVARYIKNGAISEGDILRDMMRPGLINTGWSGESTPTNNFLENMRTLTKDEEFTELILNKVRQTAFGSSASTFTDMARGVLTSAETRDPKIIKKLTEAGLEVEDARRVYDLHIRKYTQTVGTDELIDTSILYSIVKNGGVRRAPSPPEAVVSGAFRATGANSDIASEAFLFPALALIGQAIANGSVDPETVQASIGNSFSALIYNRPFLSKAGGIATNMLAGTGYKMRFISQSEDFGKELVSTVARELTIAATTGIFTEPVSRGLTSLMGQRPSFDIDELEGMRSFAAATVSMISTGILATFLGNQVYRRVRNYEPSQIEQKIKALNKEKSNIQNKAEEAEVDIETDNGIVQYEVSYSFSTDPMANVATHEAIVNVDNGFQESLDGDFYEGYSVSL